jgi:hypothetical protein
MYVLCGPWPLYTCLLVMIYITILYAYTKISIHQFHIYFITCESKKCELKQYLKMVITCSPGFYIHMYTVLCSVSHHYTGGSDICG